MIDIYSTSRKIRDYYRSFKDSAILPKAITIAEFEQRVLHVKDRILADDDLRVLLMREASSFENFKNLRIDRDFFVFLKNSEFLFRFFEELSQEKVLIDDLEKFDTYAEFSEHLEILRTLLKNYENILEKRGLFDKITLPKVYSLNRDFIKNSDGFLLHLDGLLSRFEYELFLEVSKISELKIEFDLNIYNRKLIELFKEFNLKKGYRYIINLSTKNIELKEAIAQNRVNADVVSVPTRLLQASFVQNSIAKFVQEGIKPQNIVVITPDENFASLLKNFDRFGNLNLAMGESYGESKIYKRLDAINRYLKYGELEDIYRVQRVFGSEEAVESFKDIYSKKCESKEIIDIISSIVESDCEIFQEELYKFEALLKHLKTIEFQKAFTIFLSRLSSRKVDDIRGGKVTVMGVLESRGVSYEGVIVVDFNDEFVPRRSSKDMFLNSAIRAFAKLPTKEDRENLQRYYYDKLFKNAKKVAISFVEDEQNFASRFLEELGIGDYKSAKLPEFYKPLFESFENRKIYIPKDLKSPHFIKRLSASKLKTLLTCRRKYYYKYILKIDEVEIPTENISEVDIGNILHKALHNAFKELKEINSKNLYKYLKEYLLRDDDILKEYYSLVWLERLKEFVDIESKRYEDGYKVAYLEKSLQKRYKGIVLEGKIDRIDLKDGKFFVIDYKSGKIPSCTPKTIERCNDFQLEFYYLLVRELGEVDGLYYYDLKNSRLVEEKNLDLKLEKLDEILDKLQSGLISFPKSENDSCRWCAYSKICEREEL